MLDLKFVRENPEVVKQNIKNKFPVKPLHNLCMVRDFKIRDNRFTVSFHLDILTVIPSNRHALINNIRDRKLPLVDEVIELDAENRAAKQEADTLRANRNKLFPFLLILPSLLLFS